MAAYVAQAAGSEPSVRHVHGVIQSRRPRSGLEAAFAQDAQPHGGFGLEWLRAFPSRHGGLPYICVRSNRHRPNRRDSGRAIACVSVRCPVRLRLRRSVREGILCPSHSRQFGSYHKARRGCRRLHAGCRTDVVFGGSQAVPLSGAECSCCRIRLVGWPDHRIP